MGCIKRYMIFINDPEGRSFDEYMALFRRCICMDVVLAVIYTALGMVSLMAHKHSFRSGWSIVLNASLAAVIVLWLIDAVLVCSFQRNLADSMGKPPETVEMDSIIKWKRIIVANAGVGFGFYVLHLALEMYVAYRGNVLNQMVGSLAGMAVAFVLKLLRLLAINSFSCWVRKHWDLQRAPEADSQA